MKFEICKTLVCNSAHHWLGEYSVENVVRRSSIRCGAQYRLIGFFESQIYGELPNLFSSPMFQEL